MASLTSIAEISADSTTPINVKKILIVNGYLSDELRPSLESIFDAIITHVMGTFDDDLDAALRGAIARVENDANVMTFEALSEKLDQSVRQNGQLLSRVDDLTDRLLGHRAIQGAVEDGLTAVFASLSSTRRSSQFPAVEIPFDQVLRRLDEYVDLPRLFMDEYRVSIEGLSSDPALLSLSAILGARTFVQGFRTAILNLLEDRGYAGAVEEVCARYDRIMHQLLEPVSSEALDRLRAYGFDSNGRLYPRESSSELIKLMRSLGREVYDHMLGHRYK